ncbi:hypothetical protein Scep_013556 [Stephania cephalantha]|uniref:Uncharacterized protein n=1 Tax=Stephania cephalantha TaxID=152367 RepID=A0AAP0JJ03_9MAGN
MKSNPSDPAALATSGWNVFAKCLYAFLISTAVASRFTLSTSYRFAAAAAAVAAAAATATTLFLLDGFRHRTAAGGADLESPETEREVPRNDWAGFAALIIGSRVPISKSKRVLESFREF